MSSVLCYVCGHREVYWSGPPPRVTVRGGHTVCVDVQACTERVMNPPPPPPGCDCVSALFGPEWCASGVFAPDAGCRFGKPTKAEWDRQHSVWFEGV